MVVTRGVTKKRKAENNARKAEDAEFNKFANILENVKKYRKITKPKSKSKPRSPTPLNKLVTVSSLALLMESLKNFANVTFDNNDMKIILNQIVSNPKFKDFANMSASKLNDSDTSNILYLYFGIDTIHDIAEGDRGGDLKNMYFEIINKTPTKNIDVQEFLDKFMDLPVKDIKNFGRYTDLLMTHKNTKDILDDIRHKRTFKTFQKLVNFNIQGNLNKNTKKGPTMDELKKQMVTHAMIMKGLSGKMILATERQVTGYELGNILKHLDIKIAVDAKRYSPNTNNILGISKLPQNKFIVTPAQIADSASIYPAHVKQVTYYPNNHIQLNNIQFRFEFMYTWIPVSNHQYGGYTHITIKNNNRDIPYIKYIITNAPNNIIKGERIPKTNQIMYFDINTKTLYCKKPTGPSVNELGTLGLWLRQLKTIDGKMYVHKTYYKILLLLLMDIKRSQDSSQIDMIKKLNKNTNTNMRPPTNPTVHFLLTNDLLCVSKSLIENSNVILESQGNYFVFMRSDYRHLVPRFRRTILSNIKNALNSGQVTRKNVRKVVNNVSMAAKPRMPMQINMKPPLRTAAMHMGRR